MHHPVVPADTAAFLTLPRIITQFSQRYFMPVCSKGQQGWIVS